MKRIDLCIFDVDGVLVNTRDLHYPATSFALRDFGYEYSREEDDNFGTIPTLDKLESLSEEGKIDKEYVIDIWQKKDDYLCEMFDNGILINPDIKDLFIELKNRDTLIALGSNARYSFLEKVVDVLDVGDLVDRVMSAEGIVPKPNPFIYSSVMDWFDVDPEKTLIFEDSEVGKEAAYSSGAYVYEVSSYDELSIDILEPNENNRTSSQFKRSKFINRESSRPDNFVH